MSGDAPHEATEALRAEALDLYARALDEGRLPAATDAEAPSCSASASSAPPRTTPSAWSRSRRTSPCTGCCAPPRTASPRSGGARNGSRRP